MDFSKITSNTSSVDPNEIINEASKILKGLDLNVDSSTLSSLKFVKEKDSNGSLGSAPSLSSPDAKALDKISTLSTDALMTLLGAEERETTVKTGVASLQANADEIKANNEERIQNLREQIEKAEKEKLANAFKKAFSWISTIISAVVAVASVVAGVVTANPLLIAGGVCLAVSAVDQAVQLGTGKSMFTHLAEKCGADEKTAGYIGVAIGITVGIAGAILSGAGTIQIANTLSNVAKSFNYATQIISGIASVGSGVSSIASGIYSYQGTNLKASNKDLEAILAKLQMLQSTEIEHMQEIMEKCSSMVETVNDIVKENCQTLNKVVTGGAAMA